MKIVIKQITVALFLLCNASLINLSYASSPKANYHCQGKYNTGAVYDHLYEYKKGLMGDSLTWDGAEFKIQPNAPSILYAVYVGNTTTEVIFIYTDTLKVEFISVFPNSVLIAKGQCKKV
jgi:hypothetical protein